MATYHLRAIAAWARNAGITRIIYHEVDGGERLTINTNDEVGHEIDPAVVGHLQVLMRSGGGAEVRVLVPPAPAAAVRALEMHASRTSAAPSNPGGRVPSLVLSIGPGWQVTDRLMSSVHELTVVERLEKFSGYYLPASGCYAGGNECTFVREGELVYVPLCAEEANEVPIAVAVTGPELTVAAARLGKFVVPKNVAQSVAASGSVAPRVVQSFVGVPRAAPPAEAPRRTPSQLPSPVLQEEHVRRATPTAGASQRVLQQPPSVPSSPRRPGPVGTVTIASKPAKRPLETQADDPPAKRSKGEPIPPAPVPKPESRKAAAARAKAEKAAAMAHEEASMRAAYERSRLPKGAMAHPGPARPERTPAAVSAEHGHTTKVSEVATQMVTKDTITVEDVLGLLQPRTYFLDGRLTYFGRQVVKSSSLAEATRDNLTKRTDAIVRLISSSAGGTEFDFGYTLASPREVSEARAALMGSAPSPRIAVQLVQLAIVSSLEEAAAQVINWKEEDGQGLEEVRESVILDVAVAVRRTIRDTIMPTLNEAAICSDEAMLRFMVQLVSSACSPAQARAIAEYLPIRDGPVSTGGPSDTPANRAAWGVHMKCVEQGTVGDWRSTEAGRKWYDGVCRYFTEMGSSAVFEESDPRHRIHALWTRAGKQRSAGLQVTESDGESEDASDDSRSESGSESESDSDSEPGPVRIQQEPDSLAGNEDVAVLYNSDSHLAHKAPGRTKAVVDYALRLDEGTTGAENEAALRLLSEVANAEFTKQHEIDPTFQFEVTTTQCVDGALCGEVPATDDFAAVRSEEVVVIQLKFDSSMDVSVVAGAMTAALKKLKVHMEDEKLPDGTVVPSASVRARITEVTE